MPPSSAFVLADFSPSTARCGSRTPTAQQISAPRSRDRQMREFRPVQGPARPASGIQAYGMHRRSGEQSLSARFRRQGIGKIDQDRQARRLYPTPTRARAAPRQDRCPGSAVVRGIRRQRDRHARSQDGGGQGMDGPDAVDEPYDAVADKNGEVWTGVDVQRPRRAARSQDRRVRRISAAEHDQYPPRLRRQSDHAGSSGPAAITAPRSSRSSRWIEAGGTCGL